MKKAQLLFLFAHLHKGGMQRAVSNISRALPDVYEQHVGFFGTESPGFEYKARMHDFDIPGSMSNGAFAKLLNFGRRLSALRRFVVEKEIDLVVSFGEAANVINLASGHRARTIASVRVAIEESLRDSGRWGTAYSWLIRRLYPRAHCIVAVSRELAQQMELMVRGATRVVSVPNLYDIDRIRTLASEPLPERTRFLEHGRFLLNVGSLCYQKGQDDLLSVFSRVCAGRVEADLVIVGSGEWEDRLRDLASRLGISNRVHFVGFDSNPYRYMSRAAAFVLSSRYEGFPNALVEAMACGAPVVAFDCPTGPREVLEEGEYGVLVRERSIELAADAVARILTDEEYRSRLSEHSLRRSSFYSSGNIVGLWEDLITRVLQGWSG